MFCAYCGKKMTSARKCSSCGKVSEPLRSFTRLDVDVPVAPSAAVTAATASGVDVNSELVAMQNRKLQETNKNQAKKLVIVIALLIAAVIAAGFFAVKAFMTKDASQNKNVLYQSDEEFNLKEEGARAYLNPYVREFAEEKSATFNGERVDGIKSIRLIHLDDGDKKGRLIKIGEEYIFIPDLVYGREIKEDNKPENSVSPSASPESTDKPNNEGSRSETQNENGNNGDNTDNSGDKEDENKDDNGANDSTQDENKDSIANDIYNGVKQ